MTHYDSSNQTFLQIVNVTECKFNFVNQIYPNLVRVGVIDYSITFSLVAKYLDFLANSGLKNVKHFVHIKEK